MESSKTSLKPESISEKPQDDDNDPLTPIDARIFKTCVGKAMYLSHLRILTMTAMRRLKKLTRYLLGTRDVFQELIPDQQAEVLQVQPTASGLTTKRLVKAVVEEQFSFTDTQC